MFGLEYVKTLFEYLLDRYGEKILNRIESFLFEIAKSEKFVKLFNIVGFLFFSIILVFVVTKTVEINENIRINEEKAKATIQSIQSILNRANDLISFLDNETENPLANGESSLNKVKERAKDIDINGLIFIKDGNMSVLYGSLDPTFNDPTWNAKRLNNLETSLVRMASPTPKTYLLGFERRFRTKEEVLAGTNYLGSLILARGWLKDNKINGYIFFISMSEIAKRLRLSNEEYSKGDYDYIIDQEGNLLCHPNPFIVYGTDKAGDKLKNASEESEVGQLPVNTRDADWIAGTEVLNKAFERMIRGKSTNVVYKNLQYQPRLNNFNLFPLEQNQISGNSLGLVAGKGLGFFESFMAPILLESPQTLSTVLYVTSSLYMVFILIWLFVLNKIRRLHQDIASYLPYMSPETAKKLNFIPVKTNKIKKNVMLDNAILLVSIIDKKYPQEMIPTTKVVRYLIAYFQKKEWVTQRLGITEFIVYKDFKNKNAETELTPSAILSSLHSNKIISDLKQLVDDKISRLLFNVYYTIGDITIEGLRENDESEVIVDITSKSIINLMQLQSKIKKNMEDNSNGIAILYPEELANEKSFELLGSVEIIDEIPFRMLKTQINR